MLSHCTNFNVNDDSVWLIRGFILTFMIWQDGAIHRHKSRGGWHKAGGLCPPASAENDHCSCAQTDAFNTRFFNQFIAKSVN